MCFAEKTFASQNSLFKYDLNTNFRITVQKLYSIRIWKVDFEIGKIRCESAINAKKCMKNQNKNIEKIQEKDYGKKMFETEYVKYSCEEKGEREGRW